MIEKYLNIEKYNENIQFYEKQIDNMLQNVNGFEFYDDKKINMTLKQLQAELQTLQRNLEIVKQKNEFFHNKDKKYDPITISDHLLKKLKKLLCDSKSEVEQTFKDYNNDPASMVNLLMNIFKILKEKKLKMIPSDEVQEGYEEMSKLIKRKFETIKQQNKSRMKNAKQKTIEIQKDIRANQDIKILEINAIQQQIQTKLQERIEEITKKFDERIAAQSDANRVRDHEKSKKTEINSFRNDYNSEKSQKIKIIEDRFGVIINEKKEYLEKPIRQLTEMVTLYKKAILHINYDNERQLSQFEIMLNEIPKAGPKFTKLIEHQLDNNPNDRQSIGRVLLTTSKVFSNFVTRMINKLIRGKDIDYVLEHLKKISPNGRQPIFESQKNIIKEKCKIFNEKYEQYKDLYKKNSNESIISFIATTCRDLGAKLKSQFYQNKSPSNDDKEKVELLAGIFALWVIGIDNGEESISNKLAQVGIGEEKSIVLAGLSCYLALFGFKVRCACYSAYLSCRDQSNFRHLFERLGIENVIKYGTFNQLCQDILNQDGNFKVEVQKMILEKPHAEFHAQFKKLASKFGENLGKFKKEGNKREISINQNPTILLIDQVDVFFNDNFFGSTYCPSIRLRDVSVSKFLEYVWQEVKERGQNIDPSALINSKQFKSLVSVYPSLIKLLQNQIHGMVSGALSYKHDYFLIDKKLVYKDNDTISQNISNGYKTVFANIYEHYKGKVSRSNLDEALQISLIAAEFSYAMLPRYFDSILGVTGTLQVLPQYKKRQLKERYGINNQYAIPSAFGINNRRVDNYYIVQQDTYHQSIIEKINQIQNRRPIIIFFKTARQLNQFSQSPDYEQFMKRTSNLTEEHQPSVRDSRAVNTVTITLMTNSFGRGTDFILFDQKIKQNGGLHVIQPFLSIDDSQEVQIKGRTARQSNHGSYDCIISENWLEELNLTTSNIPSDANSDAIHNILHKTREDKIENLSQTTLKLLDESDKKHQDVVQIFKKSQLAQADLIKYVSNLNEYPEITRVNMKTVLGLDATGSMGVALKKTCEIIGTAFQRAYQVLNEKKVKASIDIKIMVYRNYNSPFDEILETTAYENTPQNLRKFLQRVIPKGGWGNEALEVFFQSLNKDDRIDQVILIGDAASNTPNEVTGKRAGKGENYWNSHGFPATNIDKELQTFANKKSPVHCFYLNSKGAFNLISNKTGGTSSPFDLKSSKVADELTAFVVENVLKLIERKVGNNRLNLVQTYRKMFN